MRLFSFSDHLNRYSLLAIFQLAISGKLNRSKVKETFCVSLSSSSVIQPHSAAAIKKRKKKGNSKAPHKTTIKRGHLMLHHKWALSRHTITNCVGCLLFKRVAGTPLLPESRGCLPHPSLTLTLSLSLSNINTSASLDRIYGLRLPFAQLLLGVLV